MDMLKKFMIRNALFIDGNATSVNDPQTINTATNYNDSDMKLVSLLLLCFKFS